MKRIEVLTIFPEIFDGFLKASLIGKAIQKDLLAVTLTQIRDYSDPPHHHVDDTPYGGGAGMVMLAEPLYRAISAAKERLPNAPVILLSAQGAVFNQKKAHALNEIPELIFVCGRYEGVDQRVINLLVDEEISIGDYILMGGEVAAMAIIEATVRLGENVVGNAESVLNESFALSGEFCGLLEAPQYTKPQDFKGLTVPDVLLSGNHKLISEWRRSQAIMRTKERRPDLIK
ncbi:MAG: tRNA (guanosine(37)-N1)-methyltransferase TrmD [Oligoflexia bacterium]|nr:tRNA (guanosine(37)-N1)-methyltransferase TrmD [Oligoflexia bacterium]